MRVRIRRSDFEKNKKDYIFKKSLGFLIEFLILIFLIGKAFDTTQPLSYAVANVISNIVYGSRFEYSDSKFRATVDRANENLQIAGSVSVQVLYYVLMMFTLPLFSE
jgi:biotin transporter BioY